MIIAIDGPAGVGKSTLAKKCANRFSFSYINSGLLYRIVTRMAISVRESSDNLNDMVETLDPKVLTDEYKAHVNDSESRAEYYIATIDEHVGVISTIPKVRTAVNAAVMLLQEDNHCVVEGRDMTTVVYKSADLKIYIDADITVRARRRAAQREIKYNVALHNIQKRDKIDRQREVSPLIIGNDVIKIDTTYLTFSEAYEIMCKHIMRLLEYRGT